MSADKITYNLKNYLEKSDPLSSIEVVIELAPTLINLNLQNSSRNEKMASRKQIFIKDLEPVAKVISTQGGNILDSVWVNQTIKAEIPTKGIEKLAQLKEVNAIDLPNRISKD